MLCISRCLKPSIILVFNSFGYVGKYDCLKRLGNIPLMVYSVQYISLSEAYRTSNNKLEESADRGNHMVYYRSACSMVLPKRTKEISVTTPKAVFFILCTFDYLIPARRLDHAADVSSLLQCSTSIRTSLSKSFEC